MMGLMLPGQARFIPNIPNIISRRISSLSARLAALLILRIVDWYISCSFELFSCKARA